MAVACLDVGVYLTSSAAHLLLLQGMYIPPRFTIPRVIGAFIEQAWLKLRPQSHGNLMVIVASGLVLGEGTASILVALVNAVF